MKFLALLLALAFPLHSAEKSKADLMRSYVYTKDDADLFVGEGVAELKEQGGSLMKAKESAREKAKAALAEAVRARISSEVTEKAELKDGKVSEEIKSESKSSSDVILENIKFKDYEDFPDTGQVTVLATVSKADYRRQLSGKAVRAYSPENGIRAGLGIHRPDWFILKPGEGSPILGGGEVMVRRIVLGFHSVSAEQALLQYRPATGLYESHDRLGMRSNVFTLGYDWSPMESRLQPFFPLRAECGIGNISESRALAWGLAAGAGLRFWLNSILALEFSSRWHQGLTQEALKEGGAPFQVKPGQDILYSLTGWDMQFTLLVSDF